MTRGQVRCGRRFSTPTPRPAAIRSVLRIAGSGVQTISLLSALPPITEPVEIVGTTGSGGQPLIQLDGTSAGSSVDGLDLASGSSGSIISGLIIDNFSNDGIVIQSAGNTGTGDNTIGGLTSTPGTGAGNVISGNTDTGLAIGGSSDNLVEGNIIGADQAGTGAVPNGTGGVTISPDSPENTIGGTAAGAGNLISGNTGRRRGDLEGPARISFRAT